MFFEFQSRSHGMSLYVNFLIFLVLVLLDISKYVKFFSKLFVDLEI